MIRWNTDVNAPCCPGEIIDDETGQTVLVQTDWDFPGVASTFGWWVGFVQVCHHCGHLLDSPNDSHDILHCDDCGDSQSPCLHDETDGTVDCDYCRVKATDLIASAGQWLRDNDGITADDPGYFTE